MQSHTGSDTSKKEFYGEVRSQIKNGDVLMYRGRSLVSRLICLLTHSRYSHAGLAVWWNDRLVVMEAVGKGVMVPPLSSNVRHYDGRVEWYTSKEEISESERMQLVSFAQRELGKEYATWRAILLGLRILFNRHGEERDRLRREQKLFCSYYVAQAYNAINRDLKRGYSDRFMSPGDIAASPLLRRTAILYKNSVITEK
jgi:hypothetical protein